jgi:NAD(P)-dependent dehydrogenase (short-subunit alcohol dehydrogenase family)
VTADLAGKVAIVTGAAGDIGDAYARGLASAGTKVVLADIDEDKARTNAERITASGHEALAVGVDISDQPSVERMVAATVDRFGGLDILVNNAALMAQIPRARLDTFPLDWWDKVMAVNVKGALICSQVSAPKMASRGGGSIINQTSAGAFALSGAYSVSKLAVVGLTCVLAKDLGHMNIRVNAIAPGIVDSSAGRDAATPALIEKVSQIAPLRAKGEPDDLVGTLLFLASGASSWMTGQTLSVDGGWIMRA